MFSSSLVVGPSPPAFLSSAGSFLPLSWRAFLAASSSSGSSSGFLCGKKPEENRLKMCKCSQYCTTLPKHKWPHSDFLYLHTFFLIMCEISFAGSDDAFVGDAVDVSPPKPVDVPCKYIKIYTIMSCHLLWQCTYNNVNNFTIPVNVYNYRPQTKLWEGNVFTPVCDSVHGHVWQRGSVWQGGLHGGWVCVWQGHVWWEACMAGGLCVAEGACVAGGGCACRINGHWSGQYASYWNAFLLI